MTKGEKKKYEMVDNDGKTHYYSGRVPRVAAIKATNRGFTNIKVRQRGKKLANKKISVHVYKGKTEIVDSPLDRPDWLPEKVKTAKVRKVKVEQANDINDFRKNFRSD